MDVSSICVLAATESGLVDLLIKLAIGGLIGWVASLVMKSDGQMGIIANIVVGIVGSALGHSWPARWASRSAARSAAS